MFVYTFRSLLITFIKSSILFRIISFKQMDSDNNYYDVIYCPEDDEYEMHIYNYICINT